MAKAYQGSGVNSSKGLGGGQGHLFAYMWVFATRLPGLVGAGGLVGQGVGVRLVVARVLG